MNDNQNAFVKHSTSRVLARPGGKSSMGFLFGGFTTANSKPKKATESKMPVKRNASEMVETTAVSPQSSVVDTPEKKIEETAITAAAQIKKKNEAQNFSLFSRNPSEKKNVTSSNAFANSSSTNSYMLKYVRTVGGKVPAKPK